MDSKTGDEMKLGTLREQEGQALVFITILLMFAFIALAALAIDGGHLYVVRRDLQNMADAACLAAATEFSLGGDQFGAYQAAVDYVLANGGSEDLYTLQEGSGEGLFKGIEVGGRSVRVALVTQVPTYFTMIFNRSAAGVGARAHCNATSGGALLPIAVRRYHYNEDETQQLDLLANKNCEVPSCYYHEPEDGDAQYNEVTWLDGRYGPMKVWLPVDAPGEGEKDDLGTGNIDCDVPPPDDPPDWVGACVLGDGVATNDGTADYRGFILLDVRNVVGEGPVEYYSGATGQSNTNKDISKAIFRYGYENCPPLVGDQLAMLDGVSNDFAAQEMARWREYGEVFVAVVYSGYVWEDPDLDMRIEPAVNPDIPEFPSQSEPFTYTLTLEKTGPKPWDDDASFLLSWDFVEDPTDPISPTVRFSQNPVVLLAGVPSEDVDMVVYAANPITTTGTSYLSALTVKAAEHTGIAVTRWACTNFRYGDVGPDFTLYADAGRVDVPTDGSVDIYLTTTAFGGLDERNVDVTAEIDWGPTTHWPSVFTSSDTDRIRRITGTSESRFTLKVSPDADASPLGEQYGIKFTVGPAGDPVRTHTVDVIVNIHDPSPGGTPKKFVIVEGFAPFKISYIDANTIGAFAVGPIVETPEEVTVALQARLSAW
jgi:hypothetical protein